MWEKGGDTLQMTWYEADDYGTYLADRRAGDDTESGARVLGQDGRHLRHGDPSARVRASSSDRIPRTGRFSWTYDGPMAQPPDPDGIHG